MRLPAGFRDASKGVRLAAERRAGHMIERYVERRRRGVLGFFFLCLFWTFNFLMAVWAFSVWSLPSEGYHGLQSRADQHGAAPGGIIDTGVILIDWACGTVILGLFAMMTRGRREMIRHDPVSLASTRPANSNARIAGHRRVKPSDR